MNIQQVANTMIIAMAKRITKVMNSPLVESAGVAGAAPGVPGAGGVFVMITGS